MGSVMNNLDEKERRELVDSDMAKLFIVDRIKHHKIWKNDKFWKEAYCDSVQQQIIFSQLAAWTHNMKEFGTENAKIIKFLDSRGLKTESINVLKMTLQLNENDDEKTNNDDDNDQDDEDANDDEKNKITPTSSVGLP